MKRLRNQPPTVILIVFAVLLLLWGAGPAAAQLDIGFEPPDYQGSADGVILTGQEGWYIPAAGGNPFFVFTYDGNALQLPDNPFGETQFIGSQNLGDGRNSRAQFDFDWSQASVWTVSYDLCGRWAGTGAPQNNLGSFSLQDSNVARSFIALNVWTTITGDSWRALYQVYNASGTEQIAFLPGPEWDNLDVNHWYNQSTTFDLDQNLVLSVSITDLETGDSATVNPEGWYLQGGSEPGTWRVPTALRFFVGGPTNVRGNIMGFDNLVISPAGDSPIRGPRTKSVRVPTDWSLTMD